MPIRYSESGEHAMRVRRFFTVLSNGGNSQSSGCTHCVPICFRVSAVLFRVPSSVPL